MTRLLPLTLAVLLALSGCATTTAPEATPSVTAEASTEIVTATETPTPEPFAASVRFDACERVTVTAGAFDRVALTTADGVENRYGDFNGSVSFTANATVSEVMVFGESGAIVSERDGAVVAECERTPTPTPRPTATPTPVPTPTPEVITVTVTPEPTPQPTPTPTPQPTTDGVDLWVKTESPERANEPARNVTEVTTWLTNHHDYAVEIDLHWVGYVNGSRVFDRTEAVPVDDERSYVLEYGGEHGGELDDFFVEITGVRYDG